MEGLSLGPAELGLTMSIGSAHAAPSSVHMQHPPIPPKKPRLLGKVARMPRISVRSKDEYPFEAKMKHEAWLQRAFPRARENMEVCSFDEETSPWIQSGWKSRYAAKETLRDFASILRS